jgi:hypothetical protein
MKEKDNILFSIIDSQDIGIIGVVFTPEERFKAIKTVSIFYDYKDHKETFDKLELELVKPSIYDHKGLMDKNQLSNNLVVQSYKFCIFSHNSKV